MKKYLVYFSKIAITILFFYILFTKYIKLNHFLEILSQINYSYLLLGFIIGIYLKYNNLQQVYYCLKAFKIIENKYNIFKTQLISNLYTFVLPSEFLSSGVTWYLLTKYNKKRAEVACSLIFIRILNLLTLIPFFLIGFIYEKIVPLHIFLLFYLLLFIVLLFFLFPFISPKISRFIEQLTYKLLNFFKLERFLKNFESIWSSIETMRQFSLKTVFELVVLMLILQFVNVLLFWVIIFTVNVKVPLLMCFWLMPSIVILYYIPITIAGSGFREVGLIWFLNFYGISKEQSLIISFLLLFYSLIFAVWGAFYHVTSVSAFSKKNKTVH